MNATVTATRTITYREAVREALRLELQRDRDVFLLGEDIGAYGGVFKVTAGLMEEFGSDRVRDTPIAEAGLIGAAVGAAIAGKRPIAELMFMDFALVAADQLFNQAAKLRYLSGDQLQIPLTVRTQQGVGGGGAQHSQSFEAVFAHIPGFAVALPSTPADAKCLLANAVRSDYPMIVTEHRSLYATKGEVPEGAHLVPFGQAAVRRVGTAATIISYSRAVAIALEASDTLAAAGVNCEVIDLRTVVPLDWTTVLESVGRTGRVVIVHEGHRSFGIGAELLARISEQAWGALESAPTRVCGLDIPIPYAETLERHWLPQPDDVVRQVLHMIASE